MLKRLLALFKLPEETAPNNDVDEAYRVCVQLCDRFLILPRETIFMKVLRDHIHEVPQHHHLEIVLNGVFEAVNKRTAVYEAMLYLNDIPTPEMDRIQKFPRARQQLHEYLSYARRKGDVKGMSPNPFGHNRK